MGSITDAMQQALQKRPISSPAPSNPQPQQQYQALAQQAQPQIQQSQPQQSGNPFLNALFGINNKVQNFSKSIGKPIANTVGNAADSLTSWFQNHQVRTAGDIGQASLGIAKDFGRGLQNISPIYWLMQAKPFQKQREQYNKSMELKNNLQRAGAPIGGLGADIVKYSTLGDEVLTPAFSKIFGGAAKAVSNPIAKSLLSKVAPKAGSVLGNSLVDQLNVQPGENRLNKFGDSLATYSIFTGAEGALGGLKNEFAKRAAQKLAQNAPYVTDANRVKQGVKSVALDFSKKDLKNAKTVYRGTLGTGEIENILSGNAKYNVGAEGKGMWTSSLKEAQKYGKDGEALLFPDANIKGTGNFILEGKVLKDGTVVPTKAVDAFNPKNVIDLINGKGSSIGKQVSQGLSQGAQESAAPGVSTFYNLDRLKISKKAKNAIQGEIDNAGKQLNETVGKKLSNREVIDFADRTGQILDNTVTRDATKVKIAANLNLRRKIADAAQSGKVDKNFIDLWIKDKAAGEDIARQLQARAIVADPADAVHIQAMLDSIYKVNQNADEIAKAASGVDFNNAKQVTEFYRKFVKPKAGEWVDLLRYNSMLSSPKTHLVNASANLQGTSVIAPIEKTVAGGLDYLRSSITGGPRTRYAGEGLAYTKGYLSKDSMREASKRFGDVMRGKSFNYNPDVRNIPLASKGIGKTVEDVLSPVTKLLEASDQFFTSLTEGGSKSALAYRAAKSGIPIADVASKARDEAAYRLFRETGNSSQGYVLDAFDKVSNKLMALRGDKNPLVSTISKFTLPFVRTPTNILKQGVEYSPLGLTTLIGSSDKTGQLAKAVIGMASAAGAATLLGDGRLTWAEPTSDAQKTKFRSEGKIPYAVKIGDKWVSYSKLHPAIAFNFALIAALDDEVKNKKLSETDSNNVLDALAKYGNFIADQSYLKSIGDVIAATKGDAERYGSYFSNYAQQIIPFRALMGWVTRLTDPYQRKVDQDGSVLDKQMQYIMTQIPGLSDKVPTRKDLGGTPLKNKNPLLNAFTPLTVSDKTDISKQSPLFKSRYKELETSQKISVAKEEVARTHVAKIINGTRVYYDPSDKKVHTKKL